MCRSGKYGALCALACALTLLAGCMPASLDESLYRLPKLPAEYESLETLIDSLLADGAEYAAPASGSNLQSVQMVDLNGDGTEEAIACFRRVGDERPMKLYVFRASADSYEQYCMLEGTSNSIYSISYADIDGDGWREILLGTRGDLDVQNLSVYSVSTGKPRQELLAGYSRYATRDMDGDGRQELFVLRGDEENRAVADYYEWTGTELRLCASQRLSGTLTELNHITSGAIADGTAALFITSVTEGSIAMTDILTVDGGQIKCVASGVSGAAFHFLDLYPADGDGDGVTEVPEPVSFPHLDPEAPVYYRIRWRQYDAAGGNQVVRETFQDALSGWSLLLPESWGQSVTVSRMSGTEGSAVVFSREEQGDRVPFLTIHAFTGYNRTALASRTGRILLSRQTEVTYAAELTEDAAGWMDEQKLRESFSLIAAEWTAGEN